MEVIFDKIADRQDCIATLPHRLSPEANHNLFRGISGILRVFWHYGSFGAAGIWVFWCYIWLCGISVLV